MEPFVKLAIERWAKEVNNKHDRESMKWKFEHLELTHPHLFKGNPLKPTNQQIHDRTRAIEEGNTQDVLKMKAAKKAKDKYIKLHYLPIDE
jgi:hypothetical protein